MTTKKELLPVPLKMLCQELKIDPREARMKLRYALREKSKEYPNLLKSRISGQPWFWEQDTVELEEARKALAEVSLPKK